MGILLHTRRFRRLYRGELDFVWTVVRRLGVPDSQIEDAAHDVFVVVHRRLADFDERSSERTWIYAIARRIASRYRRTEQRRRRKEAAVAAVAQAHVDAHGPEAVRRDQARALLDAFLDTLDGPKREAFVLGEIERLPRAALARALGVKPSTAYSRLCAARAEFLDAFGPEGPRDHVVRRLARTTEPPPSVVRHRLWLALPIGPMGATVLGSAVTTVGLGTAAAGLLWVVRPAPPPQAPVQLASATAVTRVDKSPEAGTAAVRIPMPAAPRVGAAPEPAVAAPPAAARPTSNRPRSRSASVPVTPSPSGSLPSAELAPVQRPTATPTSAAGDPDLVREAQLLSQARAHMQAERWSQAWRALEQHAADFPRGRLYAERLASALTVACMLGRTAVAMDRARALLRASKSTRDRRAIEASCVGPRIFEGAIVTRSEGGDQG